MRSRATTLPLMSDIEHLRLRICNARDVSFRASGGGQIIIVIAEREGICSDGE